MIACVKIDKNGILTYTIFPNYWERPSILNNVHKSFEITTDVGVKYSLNKFITIWSLRKLNAPSELILYPGDIFYFDL